MIADSKAAPNELVRVTRKSARRDSTHALLREAGGYRLVSKGTGVREQEIWIPDSTGSPADLIQGHRELHQVGAGMTEFQIHPELTFHLLDCIKISSSAKAPDNAEDWLDVEALEEWLTEDEYLPSINCAEGLWIDPLWIRVNGSRTTALRSERRSELILHCDWDEGMHPDITTEYLSWGFYGESGGPCTFDGGASLGRCGSGVLALHQWGDYNPQSFVAFHPTQGRLARELTNWIWSLDWELPFLRGAVGFPGLTPEELQGIWENDDIEGTHVGSHLDPDVKEEIVRQLCRRSPQLRAAAHALRHPRSQRGKAAYGWARLLAGDDWASSTWEYVDRALLGQLDPPGPDPSPRSLSDILEERLDRTVAQMHGWAQAVPIDSRILSALEELAKDQTDPDSLRVQIEELEVRADRLPVEQSDARELLGVTPETSGKALWEAYEARKAQDPGNDWDYLDAYHLLHNPLGPSVEECRSQVNRLRTKLASLEAARDVAVAAGWPGAWDPLLYPLWTSCGGTMESASAWAALGWSPFTVLGEGQLQIPWNAPISARVTTVSPPEMPVAAQP